MAGKLEQASGIRHENGVLLSLVVPMYNEANNLEAFFARTGPVLERIETELGGGHEIVCVDDGSTDSTVEQLVALRDTDPAIKIVSLTRNFGKDIALTAGFDYVTGAAVVPIDADLQHPPEVIPELVAKWREGYDVVYAKRTPADAEAAGKRMTASFFYRVYNALADLNIPENAGDFRLMDRRVIEALRRFPERNRFMKGLYAWAGFRQTGVDYVRETRASGRTKWSYWRLWNFALDGITSSTTLPLRVWSYIGSVIALLAFAYAFFEIVYTLVTGIDVPGYASLIVMILFMGGTILLNLGIIGEYLGRIYMEVKARPTYLVRETHGIGPDGGASAGKA